MSFGERLQKVSDLADKPPRHRVSSVSIILVGPEDHRDADLALQNFGQILWSRIGAARFGVDKAGAQVNDIRLHLGKLHGHPHIGGRATARAFAFYKRHHLGRLTELAFPKGSRFEASPFPGAAITALHIRSATDNSHFLQFSSSWIQRFEATITYVQLVWFVQRPC